MNVHNAPVSDVLNICFQYESLSYTISDGRIVVKPAQSGVPDVGSDLPPPIAIHGQVTDSLGNPLVGASISVKGSKGGVSTDGDGNFVLNGVDDHAVLIISFTGYENKQYTLSGQSDIKVFLSRSNNILGEIVVTALGIRRSEKSLSYSAQIVHGEELTRVKTDNLMNAVNGKVAGITISPSASGIGGSVKVLLHAEVSQPHRKWPFIRHRRGADHQFFQL